jgi:non-canonical (house-cleaning) NTP pyrophosphatase
MKIHVGSQNITKVTAVRNAVVLYPAIFTDPEVIGIDVQVDLHGHPKNMLQTMSGAKQRACNAFSDDCTYSIGLEGGLMSTLGSQSSYMEVGAWGPQTWRPPTKTPF